MKFSFQKWQALGNDFIITEALPNQALIDNIPLFCHRKYGIGADGFIILNMENSIPEMHFYNADGSKVSMCGNGLRCVMEYLIKLKKEPKVRFGRAIHEAFFENERLYISMPESYFLDSCDTPYQGVWVNAGVPHFLIEKHDVHHGIIEPEVFQNRYHKAFGEGGTNITFYEKKDDAIYIRTAERGVDEETLSCGSAACAVAHLYDEDDLTIMYRSQNTAFIKKKNKTLYLAGDAKFVFSGFFSD